jgi:[ribosomal protein S5]-alanine N-acetyltransferase
VIAPTPVIPTAWQGEALERALHDTLLTARLALEPLTEQHADELWLPLTDLRLYEHVPQDPPVSMAALRERLALLEARRSPQGDQLWLNWAMRERHDGGLRGRLQATVLTDATAWIAYEVFPEHWRQGYATEGNHRMIEWLIDTLGVAHLAAEVDSLNEASLRSLERLGFQRTAWREAADEFKGRVSHEWTLRLDATRFTRLQVAFAPASGAHGPL